MDPLEKIKLVNELKNAKQALKMTDDPLVKMKRAKRVFELLDKLGALENKDRYIDEKEIDVDALDTDLMKYQTDKDKNLSDTVKRYIEQNLQGKYINTVIGKVFFTGVSKGELRLGTAKNILRAKLIPFVPQTLTKGKYLGKQPPYKERDDFIAFHDFQYDVIIDDKKVNHLVRVAERANGDFIFIAYHSRSVIDKGTFHTSETVSSIVAGRSEADTVPLLDNVRLESGIVNDDDWNIEIISITDLNGNIIHLGD